MFRRHKRRAIPILLAAVALAAGSVAGEQKEPAKLPPEIESAFVIAMAAPPEIAASALLRLNTHVAGQTLRRDLLEMAFHLAAKAQYPIQLISFPGIEADTRTGSLGRALQLKLDALSLESRAVQDMIAVDPGRARELFGAIARPALPVLSCDASLLPDVSPYFDALVAVTQGAFSPQERTKGEHLAFAAAALSRASAIAEFGLAGYTLASLDLPQRQFDPALRGFASKLASAPADSRSFLLFSKSIDTAVGLLVARARQLGVSPETLIASYRRFLLAQFHVARCIDSGTGARMILPSSLFGEAIRGEKPPISEEEMTPAFFDSGMKLEPYWATAEAERINVGCLKLRQGLGGSTSSDAASQVTDFLNSLENWGSNSEASEEDYYHQKAIVYEVLLEVVPPGAPGDRVIDSFVSFLKSSNLQQRNAVEWYWHVRAAVNRVLPRHPDQAAKILAAYRSSGNIVLMLEAMLDQVAPLSPVATPR